MHRLHDPRVERPVLSVVIATSNRASLLRSALQGLTCQTLARTAFEVVVIDDGSIDETSAVVADFGATLPMRAAFQRPAGLASARNHGLFRSSSDIVLFLDDDDVAAPSLLEQHLRTHRLYPQQPYAVLGFTAIDARFASDPLMRFVTEVEGHLFSYSALEPGRPLDFSCFWGGRTSCKRAFLLEHGVFDPRFRFGCEDIELGYRLSKHGLTVIYDPEARSTMNRAFSFDGFCERLRRQGQSTYRFSKLHDDPVVQAWTRVADATQLWAEIRSGYDVIMSTARRLDHLARLKTQAGFELTNPERGWLEAAYSAACQAARSKGIIEAQEGRANG